VKGLFGILCSLLLLATQIAGAAAQPGPVTKAPKCACCDGNCACCVSESGTRAVPPLESLAPIQAPLPFLPPPGAALHFLLATPGQESPPGTAAELLAPAPPLYRRDCALRL
jgi:hypothetical protein